jgi:hypothetical protein
VRDNRDCLHLFLRETIPAPKELQLIALLTAATDRDAASPSHVIQNMIGNSRPATASIAIGVVVLLSFDAAHCRVSGFSSVRRHLDAPLTSAPPLLNPATINAAEVLDSAGGDEVDGSFFVGECETSDEDCLLFENSVAVAPSSVDARASITSRNDDDGRGGAASSVARRAMARASNNRAALMTVIVAIASLMSRGPLLRRVAGFASWYMTRLDASPLMTKCVTGGIVALLGDYAAQRFEYSSSSSLSPSRPSGGMPLLDWDRRRGVARFLECLLISTPLMHLGYDYFEFVLPIGGAGSSGVRKTLATLSHVVADSVFLDGVSVGTAIVFAGLLEGHSLRGYVLPNLREVYRSTYLASVVTSAALLPVQFLSFRFLPVQLRVLSVNALDLVWTAVVSFVSHNGAAADDARD